jgi:hypothetical protein
LGWRSTTTSTQLELQGSGLMFTFMLMLMTGSQLMLPMAAQKPAALC